MPESTAPRQSLPAFGRSGHASTRRGIPMRPMLVCSQRAAGPAVGTIDRGRCAGHRGLRGTVAREGARRPAGAAGVAAVRPQCEGRIWRGRWSRSRGNRGNSFSTGMTIRGGMQHCGGEADGANDLAGIGAAGGRYGVRRELGSAQPRNPRIRCGGIPRFSEWYRRPGAPW
jgi:hypothetical protein